MPTTYEELINRGGTIYKGSRGYATPEELSADLGISGAPDWSRIREEAPPVAPPAQPVIRYGAEQSPYTQYMESLYGGGAPPIWDTSSEAERQNQIREQQIRNYQGLIDSINAGFATQVSAEQQRGVERAGQTRAISARSGLLTSPMGGAMEEKTKEYTKENVRIIEQQRQEKIASIFTKIDERTEAKLQADKELALKKSEDYVAGLQELEGVKKQRKADTIADLKEMGQTGVDITQIEKEDKDQLKELLGFNDFQLDNALKQWSTVKEEEVFNGWKGDSYVVITKNPNTNKVSTKTYTAEDLGIPKGTEIDTMTDGEGNTYLIDKNDPYNKDGTPKVQMVGEKKVETIKGPTSYQEWIYAGGKAGTGKSYAEFISAGTEMNSKQVAIFNSLIDKQNKSPLVAANDRASILKTVTSNLENDPTNAALQVSFIYSMIQALDTYQSAVREGEIGLLSSTQGLGEKIMNLPSKIQRGNPLAVSKINEYIGVAKMLTDSIGSAAKLKRDAFKTQAEIAGVGTAFNEYQSSVYGEDERPYSEEDSGFKVGDVVEQDGVKYKVIDESGNLQEMVSDAVNNIFNNPNPWGIK